MLSNFLGKSPLWYKFTIIGFIVFNFLLYFMLPMFMDKQAAMSILSWLFIAEFIFTLAMALNCYPLQSGGLLTIQILALRLTTPQNAFNEVSANLEVILLLMFMVAGIFFMKPLLMYIFSKVFIKVRSKLILSLIFTLLAAFLSAFLDALTVTAVLISVAVGFYGVYHKIQSGESDYDASGIADRRQLGGEALEKFRAFLRSLMMHGVVGTALGGVTTLVGEPQNLLIGEKMGLNFIEFFVRMAPVSLPVLVCGIITTILLEKLKLFGYGEKLSPDARKIIEGYVEEEDRLRTPKAKYGLIIQAIAAVFLIIGLATHIAPVGLVGLGIIIFQTAFMGITEEHGIGPAFEEALPFTALIVVFFVVVAMIHDQHLFTPIINWVLEMPFDQQPGMFYIANGLLSMISDNVFVATVYINEVFEAYKSGNITKDHLDILAVAINTGTNLPSVATPNGQAAFLFLLTSSLAPLIKLSYIRMVIMALPYTVVMGLIGYICIINYETIAQFMGLGF
ncbi:MAG: sodium/proton antiporter NhaB [Flavobacteriaceae bacterium]|nr:sodium/proton antiporter NhaB [Flavobacteriaceae bacterium]